MEDYWIYPTSTLTTFLAAAIRGFQHKNVIGGHMKAIVFTSFIMATFEVLSVSIVVHGGLPLIPWVGTGAALGMYVSLTAHDRIFGRKKAAS